MNKAFYLLIMILLYSVSHASQTPHFDNFIKQKTMEASFIQSNYYHGLDPYYLEGKVYIIRGSTALWDYNEPVEYYLMKKNQIIHYSEELNQLLIFNTDISDIDDTSSLLLSIFMDPDSITKKFMVVELKGSVTLIPISNKDLEQIVIDFDDNGRVSHVYADDTQGNSIMIQFLNVEYNKKIDGKVFDRPVPEGVDIIEQ